MYIKTRKNWELKGAIIPLKHSTFSAAWTAWVPWVPWDPDAGSQIDGHWDVLHIVQMSSVAFVALRKKHGAATTKRPKICLDCMSLQVCKARLFFVIFSGILSWHSSQSYLAAYPIIIQATHHAAENGREDVEDKVHIDLRGLETLGSMVGSCSLGKPMGHATAKRMERWCWLWDQHNTTKKVWIQWIPDSLRIYCHRDELCRVVTHNFMTRCFEYSLWYKPCLAQWM